MEQQLKEQLEAAERARIALVRFALVFAVSFVAIVGQRTPRDARSKATNGSRAQQIQGENGGADKGRATRNPQQRRQQARAAQIQSRRKVIA